MAGKIMSPKRRKALGRGQGEKPDMDPFIKPKEAKSSGVATNIPDATVKKMKSTLSKGEAAWFMHFRLQPDIEMIQTQKLLDQGDVDRICDEHGKKRLQNLSTDLYVVRKDGTKEAYSIKDCKESVETARAKERIAIETIYWEEKDVKFDLKFKTDFTFQEIKNYIDIYPSWKCEGHDSCSRIRHAIAVGDITIDMTKPIDYEAINRDYPGRF